ncbi:MAG: hypothetical protein LBK57_11395 [Clostridiales Family XIII bacterium]|jgi:hypothetical protein|nr:hypothetical protein [Clostridiales Family XIII bacterium]
MSISSKTSSSIFQRMISVFLTLAVLIGLLPAFSINASAATVDWWGDMEKHYSDKEISHNLKAGQKIKLQYVYNTNPDGEISERDKGEFLEYTNGNKASVSPGFWVATFPDGETIDTMPAYCIEHGVKAVQKDSELTLEEYMGDESGKALVEGVFANGYRNIPYEIFVEQLVPQIKSTAGLDFAGLLPICE